MACFQSVVGCWVAGDSCALLVWLFVCNFLEPGACLQLWAVCVGSPLFMAGLQGLDWQSQLVGTVLSD